MVKVLARIQDLRGTKFDVMENSEFQTYPDLVTNETIYKIDGKEVSKDLFLKVEELYNKHQKEINDVLFY